MKIKVIGGPRDGEVLEFDKAPPLFVCLPHQVHIYEPYGGASFAPMHDEYRTATYRLVRERTPTDDGFSERWFYRPD